MTEADPLSTYDLTAPTTKKFRENRIIDNRGEATPSLLDRAGHDLSDDLRDHHDYSMFSASTV